MTISAPAKARLSYIDWMRGLACVLMFQTHCYDAWLGGAARQSRFFMYSQLGGTFPAPLFLFLAGISFALVTGKLISKQISPDEIGRKTIWRSAEIFGFAMLLRLQEYVIAWGWAPKSDLLRVDILNTIGLSMMLMGVLCWTILRLSPTARQKRTVLILAPIAVAGVIAAITPLLWTTWRPIWLPWPIESYINGVHNLGTPQAWLFPLFPWSAFAFAGLAAGFLLQRDWARSHQAAMFFAFGGAGLVLIVLARWADALPIKVYPVYDYWHTSPQFWILRLGMILLILTASYVWCRWGAGQWGFSPLIQLGQASLLVYWVHIEFVYGRVSILAKRAQSIGGASKGLLIISFAMVVLAYLRTHFPGWMKKQPTNDAGMRPAATPAS